MTDQWELQPEYKWPDNYVETWDGKPIIGMQEFKGMVFVFTSTAVYQLRKMQPRERMWLRVKRIMRWLVS